MIVFNVYDSMTLAVFSFVSLRMLYATQIYHEVNLY